MAGQWHYQHGGQNHGPLTSADLKESAVAGKLLPTDLVWKEGMEKWVPAKSVKGLFPAGVAATDKPTPTTQTPAKAVRTGPPPLPDDDDVDDEYRSQAKTRPSRRTLLIAGGSVIGLVVLTLAGLMIFGGRGGNGSNNKTASELMAELRECREKAHREFGGKTFTVTGKVNQVMTDSLYLRGTDKEYGSTVYCQFGSGEFGDAKGRAEAIQQLRTRATISCRIISF